MRFVGNREDNQEVGDKDYGKVAVAVRSGSLEGVKKILDCT